jgi:hypothetical protein
MTENKKLNSGKFLADYAFLQCVLREIGHLDASALAFRPACIIVIWPRFTELRPLVA